MGALMLAVFALTLPIYLLIALGFFVAKVGYVAVADMRAIGRVVLRVAMPALIFLALARAPLAETLRWDFMAGYAVGSLVIFTAGFALARGPLRRPMPQAALEALGMACSNSAYLGMPVAAILVGDVALQAFAMAMLVENIVILPLAVVLAEASGGGGRMAAFKRTLGGMVRNPLLIAVLVGVAASLTGLVLPAAVMQVMGMLAPVAAPVALLVIGSAVADLPPSGVGGAAVARVVFGKLVLHPLAVLAGFYLFGPPAPALLISGVLIASVPMLSTFALFGLRWGNEALAATSLIVATVVSFFTVSGLLALLG
ncbi:MAG: permease [Alphaproteobacteria bacterium HGW-Alphaproteobacteria-4]|nr:MAG: permease [Alphaproteobacteria bacterium HGW-Alphaproteobacteria-4]